MITAKVYPRYSVMFPTLKAVRDSLDASYFSLQAKIEAEAMNLHRNNPADAVRYLTAYTGEKAGQMLARWQQLAFFLIVKYNDMAVKPDVDGRFVRTATGLGARVERPGFPEKYAKELIKQTGTKYLCPDE